MAGPAPITETEAAEIERANASGAQPVVFVHGLWLLPNSWDRWREHAENRGYVALAPSWPDDPATVEEGRRDPDAFAGKTVGAVTDHIAGVIKRLTTMPVVIGHSFGGLITQKLAGMGLVKTSVAIDPAPFRGVLALPISALRSSAPVLRNPVNRKRAVMLTYEQFRYAFVNAVPEKEAKELYDEFPVPGAGAPLFQAAFANLNSRSEASVDSRSSGRGPLLIISGEKDHTVPWAIANGSYKRQRRNPGATDIKQISGRGHSLVIDHGWQEVADVALDFADQHGR